MKYFVAHKGKTFSLLLVISLSIFCVYFVSSIVQSIFETAKEANISSLESFSIITPDGSDLAISENDWNAIKNDSTVGTMYRAYVEETYVNNIFGKSSGFIYFLDIVDVQDIFEHCGFSLIQGRFPTPDTYEIIMQKDMMKNKNLSIGDKFGNNVSSDEQVVGEYTIVGSFDGRGMLGFGSMNYNVEQWRSMGMDVDNALFAGIIVPKNNISAMNRMLDSKNDMDVFINTADSVTRIFEEQAASINSLMLLIIIIIEIAISVAVGVTMSTLYSGRMNEFGILFAIGYSKKRILCTKVLKELFGIIFISWFFGLVLSFIGTYIVNIMVFEKMGQSMNAISVQSIRYSIISLAVILLITITPIVIKLSKADLIAVIERR